HPVALEVRPLVGTDPQPGEAVEDHPGVLLGAALLVGVLDPQNEAAGGGPGKEPVEERGAGSADMEVAGGRWGEANPDGRVSGVRHRVSWCLRAGIRRQPRIRPSYGCGAGPTGCPRPEARRP